ncbi:FG-GAP-like repeat-containing protein [Rhodopirellula sp. MGV]|uniref:FG-GAP-like repeat-containing protein n=1 Tax=Rhodopirellula sp. MGV TaxID=2023130 RepID=UPI000B9723DB|nr:FG-GAP-like repeat-containing protein [Rhodopirellula sp. MGV]OYP29459.1 hypothetical protein CGZ80_25005 [Rhodopirellula sp. MGV]PNY35766.1 RNA-binding protein [Rhodopirellula baltica]
MQSRPNTSGPLDASDCRTGQRNCLLYAASLIAILLFGVPGCKKDRPPQPPEPPIDSQPELPSAQEEAAVASPSPSLSREQQIDQALAAQDNGQFDKAIESLQQLLLQDPHDYVAMFHMANAEAGRGNLKRGIDLLSEIPPTDPDSGLPALGVAADWSLQLGDFSTAEQRYRQILQLLPQFQMARRRLAFLLNRQGRRFEANQLIRELCRAGDIMQDELFSLIVETDAMYDAPQTPNDPSSTLTVDEGERLYWPIGPLGEARHQFTEQNYESALSLLRPVIESGNASPATLAFYGLALVEGQHEDEFQTWLAKVTDRTKAFPEYWAAIGFHLVRETEYARAVGALAEAIRLDPTDNRSVRRLIQCFRSLDDEPAEQAFQTRYKALNRVITLGNDIAASSDANTEKMNQLADELVYLGRPLEAILWKSLAVGASPDPQAQLQQLGISLKQIANSPDAFSSTSQRWCGIDLSEFDKPDLSASEFQIADKGVTESGQAMPWTDSKASFRNIASAIGLDQTYRVATTEKRKAFAIYQQLGGGVAVLDYDLDGWCDLYFAQGDAAPPQFVAKQSDTLYRHTIGDHHRLINQTDSAQLTESQYTIGVTSGDWNQDGFPDLAISNIGTNQLLINRGDGTFTMQNLDAEPDHLRCAASLAMGDISGDGLPDLVVLNYVRDPNLAKLPELDSAGNVTASLPPLEFKPAHDVLYQNAPTGLPSAAPLGDTPEDACTGLGAIIANFDQDSTNELFVGNDALQNQLWKINSNGTYDDLAIATGCAYGAHSLATAAMGIAVADFDRSGTLDFHVTNFSKEPVSLYLGRDGMFRDLSIRYGLSPDSVPMVGFGTQPIDFNNDGWPDLVVANGHVDDLSHTGVAFDQPPQLFANYGETFELIAAGTDPYWTRPSLGRAVAMLDFDRDGKQDFVVTDLIDQASVMINESVSEGNWIQIKLIGTTSERDSIGAHITVISGAQTWHQWVTSGDGYLCKNESANHFGVGAATTIDQVVVEWPSGQRQTFTDLPINRSSILIEGQAFEAIDKND